jgi:exosome complex exonuclease RRP6
LNANQKPQLSFKDKIDNSNTNWTPIIKYKPNAKVPLGSQISPEMTEHMSNFPQNSVQNAPCHPYEYEITNLEYPNLLFTKAPEIMSSEIQNVEPIWVDSSDGLENLCQELSLVKLFAVDLEVLFH